jgi:anti-anti-sigma factor
MPRPRLEVSGPFVRIVGCTNLSDDNIEPIGRALNALVEEHLPQRLLLDLAGIDYITSTPLGTLVSLNRRLRALGGGLAVTNVGPKVREVLSVTRLDKLIEVRTAA